MSIKKLLTYLLVGTLYMYSIALSRGAFDFYLVYLGFLVLLPFALVVKPDLKIQLRPLVPIAIFLLIQFIVTFQAGSNFGMAIKQIILIVITLFVLYLAFSALDFDLILIFKAYYNSIHSVCVLIIFQQFAYLLGVKFLYDLSWMLNISRVEPTEFGLLRTGGLQQEPAHFVFVAFPALFFALNRIFRSEINGINMSLVKAITILIGYILTFSSIGILGFFFFSLFKLAHKSLPKLMLGMGFVFIVAIFAYNSLPFFQYRVKETFEYSSKIEDIQKTDNWSTYALLSNAYVTLRSLDDHLLFGVGIGNHVINHQKYLGDIVTATDDMYSLNKEDANSLLLRLLSEVGIVGFLILVYFLFRFKLHRSDCERGTGLILFSINEGVFILVFLKLIRDGNYAVNGFLFFILLYYYSFVQAKKLISA